MKLYYVTEEAKQACMEQDWNAETPVDYDPLRSFLDAVGIGWFTIVRMPNNTVLLVDDEGILKGMEPTIIDTYNGQYLYGPCVVMREKGEDLYPPTKRQYDTLKKFSYLLVKQ